jgi:type VI secretion system protein ImpH
LHAQPQQFGFFQAVRLLDRWLSAGAPGSQGLTRLHFRNSLALSFPPSEIEALQVVRQVSGAEPQPLPQPLPLPPQGEAFVSAEAGPADALSQVLAASPMGWAMAGAGEVGVVGVAGPVSPLPAQHEVSRVEMTPAFMGLLGVAGTLPFHYTEQLAHRELYQKDTGARAFMDIFSHRAVTLFYEAWRKHRLPFQFEADRRQRYLPLVLSLAGLGHKGLRDRLGGARGGVADESLAYFAGALQQRTRSARQLQQLLQQYLGVPVAVEQFVGRWYDLPADQMPSLGGGLGLSGKPAILGRTTSLGERVWQRDLRMRLVLGPLPHGKFLRFLPGGVGAKAMKELLTLYGGVALEYEVNLRLQQQDVRGFSLDSRRAPTAGRLGWDTFVQTQPANDDRADVRYDIHAA